MGTKNKILPIVAIVGRPNVGKSSLFNRILHRKIAVVHDTPGVTRDRHYAPFDWNGKSFLLVDTGGILPNPLNELELGVLKQIESAIEESDLILFIVEPELRPDDYQVADILRKTSKPVIIAVNKVDNPGDNWSGAESEKLGLGDVFRVSAKFGYGTGDLLDEIVSKIPEISVENDDEDITRIAIVGRPNVGKSSFLNKLIGEEVALVHSKPGTTRDPVNARLNFFDTTYEIVDTAGLFKKQKNIEYFSALRTIKVIERCDIVLLILDATEGITRQDKRISAMAMEKLRGLVIAVNKWDLIEKKFSEKKGRINDIREEYENKIRQDAPFLASVPIVFVSALTGFRVHYAMEVIHRVASRRKKRITTSQLNELVQFLQTRRPPPVYRGRRSKILYATQADISPPEFVFFTKMPQAISPSYRRYISNQIRKRFGFDGVMFKLVFRNKSN